MAQQSHQLAGTVSTFAENIGVTSGASETIVLDKVPCFGGRNLAVTIVNQVGSPNNISAVALYGSPDGINYVAVNGFNTFTVATGATNHAECTGIWQYLRVTATGAAIIDVYLYAI